MRIKDILDLTIEEINIIKEEICFEDFYTWYEDNVVDGYMYEKLVCKWLRLCDGCNIRGKDRYDMMSDVNDFYSGGMEDISPEVIKMYLVEQ